MKQKDVLYTNGRDVAVTQLMLQSKNEKYRLTGITNYGCATLEPQRLPGLLFIIAGILILTNGFNLFNPNFFLLRFPKGASENLHLLIASSIILIGILYTILIQKRYAVKIQTAEGFRHAVVSSNKEHVYQILNAIRRAKLPRTRRGI